MKPLKSYRPSGFTIVEVLIVLAIGSLIMLTVFLAVPQLQRNNRNNQRSTDAARVLSAVNECISNNNGIIGNGNCLQSAGGVICATGACQAGNNPIIGCSSGTLDMTKLVLLTTVNLYNTSAVPPSPPYDNNGSSAYVYGGYICSGSGGTATGSPNQFVVLYEREAGGGAYSPICLASP